MFDQQDEKTMATVRSLVHEIDVALAFCEARRFTLFEAKRE